MGVSQKWHSVRSLPKIFRTNETRLVKFQDDHLIPWAWSFPVPVAPMGSQVVLPRWAGTCGHQRVDGNGRIWRWKKSLKIPSFVVHFLGETTAFPHLFVSLPKGNQNYSYCIYIYMTLYDYVYIYICVCVYVCIYGKFEDANEWITKWMNTSINDRTHTHTLTHSHICTYIYI